MPLATLAASRKDAVRDHVVRVVPLLGLGLPAFWFGLILQTWLGTKLRLFPVTGYGSGFTGHLQSMFLPALTVAVALCPVLIRSLRASMLGVLGADFVTTARAKGVPTPRLLVRHVLRNAVIPAVTVLGINIGYLIGGTLIVEQVFAIPGLGSLMIDAIFAARLHRHPVGRPGLRRAGGPGQPAHRRGLRRARPESEVRRMSAVSADSAPPAAPAPRRRGAAARAARPLVPPADPDDGAWCCWSIILFMCYGAPLLTSFDPDTQNLEQPLLGLGQAGHLLGTDQEGRDTWARLLYGGQVDLRVAVIAVIFPFILGTILGSLAGYFGGWVDAIIMRIIDIVVAFPFFVLVIALVFVLGTGEKSIYIAITAVGWVSYARITRGEITVAKRQEYVLAAQSGGLSSLRIIGRHLLPNVITQSIVYAMSDIVQDILAIVTLSYLGLGIQPPTPDWGTMISAGQNFLTTQWQLTTIPGLAVVITGLALSLIGDGLADLLRPGTS